MWRVQTNSDMFAPGQPIEGTVEWSDLPVKTKSIEVRLIWHTEGKGTLDFELIASKEIDFSSLTEGSGSFSFIAPHRPLSFSGQLISLVWAIEVIAFPTQESERKHILISNSKHEILLVSNQTPDQ